MGCLDDNLISAYLDGRLSDAQNVAVQSHLDSCPPCKTLLASLALPGGGSRAPAEPQGASADWARLFDNLDAAVRGASVGRYVLGDLIGRGGMGELYEAYDPELDRKVALKLLRPDLPSEHGERSAQSRLMREAQAMARLSHPNVITVFDVQTLDNQVVIAMEYIDGCSLESWLARPRSRQEILEVFTQAGRGLAAAHRAGLVHRDFKPANVLISAEGRAFVTDFGLARAVVGERELEESFIRSIKRDRVTPKLDDELTRSGTLLGTPAFMAPEQLLGRPVDARSDQFSFCVAMWEALFDERPFQATSFDEIKNKILTGDISAPRKSRGIPAWIRNVLMRGLSTEPAARYASMNELLAALDRDPLKRRWIRVSVAIAALGVTAGVAAVVLSPQRSAVICEVPTNEAAGMWDDPQRHAARSAFAASGIDYAADTFARVDRHLRQYADRWKSIWVASCNERHVAGRISDAVLALRQGCLRRRREELRVLADRLAQPIDRAVLNRSVEAAIQLPALSRCAEDDVLAAKIPPPESADVYAEVSRLRTALSRAETLDRLGKTGEGLEVAQQALARSREIGYPPIHAESLFWVGKLHLQHGSYDRAEEALRDAAHVAGYIGDRTLFARASWGLVWTTGATRERVDKAVELLRLADEKTLSSVLEDPERALEYFTVRGVIQLHAGDLGQAEHDLRRAVEVTEQTFGPEHPTTVSCLHNLAAVLIEAGKNGEAALVLRRALAIAEEVLGLEHYTVGMELAALGEVIGTLGELDEGRTLLERGLEIQETTLGSDNPYLASTLNALGRALLAHGDHGSATEHFERTLAIARHSLGETHSEAALAHLGLAMVATATDRPQDAVVHLEPAIAGLDAKPARARDLARARFELARVLWSSVRDRPRSLRLARQARELLASSRHPASPAQLRAVDRWLAERDILSP